MIVYFILAVIVMFVILRKFNVTFSEKEKVDEPRLPLTVTKTTGFSTMVQVSEMQLSVSPYDTSNIIPVLEPNHLYDIAVRLEGYEGTIVLFNGKGEAVEKCTVCASLSGKVNSYEKGIQIHVL